MYSLLIVDDEPHIRRGLSQLIPWQTIGITQVQAAASGPEALALIRQSPPQVLITDINMLEMNGLELIRAVNEEYPGIKVIVLTGYDDFEYARTCLRMQVEDFLLKPVDEEQLLRRVYGLLEELEAEKRRPLLRRAQYIGDQMQLEDDLRRITRGDMPEAEIGQWCLRYGLDPACPLMACLLIPEEIPAPAEALDEYQHLRLFHLLADYVDAQREGITFSDAQGSIVCLAFATPALEEPHLRIHRLCALVAQETGIYLRMFQGEEVEGLAHASQSYQQALHRHQAEAQKGETAQRGPVEKADQPQPEWWRAYDRIRMEMHLHSGDYDATLGLFDAFAALTERHHLPHPTLRTCCFELSATIYYAIAVDLGECPDQRLSALLQSILQLPGERLLPSTREFIAQLFGQAGDGMQEMITQAKAFISSNLAEELSVARTAQHLHITPNYLSRLFKRATGEGCNEYIVRKRMEKARDLLEATGLKSGEVAALVGYQDQNYFSLAFKKYTNLSPTAFREQVRGKGLPQKG